MLRFDRLTSFSSNDYKKFIIQEKSRAMISCVHLPMESALSRDRYRRQYSNVIPRHLRHQSLDPPQESLDDQIKRLNENITNEEPEYQVLPIPEGFVPRSRRAKH